MPQTVLLTAETTMLEVPLLPLICLVALQTVATTTLAVLSQVLSCQNVLSNVGMVIQVVPYKQLAQKFALITVAMTTQQLP